MDCIIVSTAYPLRGGIAHYNALLARTLRKRHRVETVTFKRQYPALLFPGTTQQEAGPSPVDAPAPQLIDSINPLNWIRVGRELRRRAPDLLLFKYWIPFFGPCFGTIARWSRRGSLPHVIFICDNVLPHERRPFDRLFTRYAFGSADAFIVQSDAVETDLLSFWPRALYRKVPHPIYDAFGPGSPQSEAREALGLQAERILLFFGYIRRYKGLDVLLRALARARREMKIHLLVVGEFYEDEARYRKLVGELELEESVQIVSGYLPNELVARYFSAADAVVLPYTSATQSGIAQIAYHYDTPVIATSVGGLAEVVLDEATGFVVPPGDPDALAGALLRFYREGRSADFKRAIQTEKRKYSWDRLVDALEELVDELDARRGKPAPHSR